MTKLNDLVLEHQQLDKERQQVKEKLTGLDDILRETEQANKEVKLYAAPISIVCVHFYIIAP